LTYLDCGNALIQLVEPLAPRTAIGNSLERNGEGLHHVCFEVRDVGRTAAALADPGAGQVQFVPGDGRLSAFVPGPVHHGTPIECTKIDGDES
jgi:methylmalonyl-CoA/ethylmalonyl-CoA epimerase